MEEMTRPELILHMAGLDLAIFQKIGDAIADDVIEKNGADGEQHMYCC
jgi:hypothetical protein